MNKDKDQDNSDLDKFLIEELTKGTDQDKIKENGYLISGLALSYLQTMNQINTQYKILLEQALGEIDSLSDKEHKFKDRLNLAKVQVELS